ncbi:MAG: thioredoxin [Clostridium butyricum]|nr:thioredoxin [Clostridium butyricum]
MAKVVNTEEFREEIKSGVTLVDFFATWCGPCKMLAPVLEDLASEMEGKVKIIKVDIDESSDLADEFRISSVPTMIIFKDGKQADMMVGFLPKDRIKESLEAQI